MLLRAAENLKKKPVGRHSWGDFCFLCEGCLSEHEQNSTWNLLKNALLPEQSHLSMCKTLSLGQNFLGNPNLVMSQCQN